jgi:type II secretory pathway component PulJ
MSALRRHLPAEDGFTLVELLVAATIMIVVLGAALSALDGIWRVDRENTQRNTQQDAARNAMDQIAREVRNGTAYAIDSSPTQSVVLRNGDNDLVFKTVDPNTTPAAGATNSYGVERVRYCKSGTRLYRETQTWTGATPAIPSDTSCPGTGWTTQRIVVSDVVNTASQPVFTYGPSTAATLADYATIGMELDVDNDGSSRVAASRLTGGVELRNQNQKPTATFTATPTGNLHVQLNGSASTDPEGATLQFQWQDGSTVLTSTSPTLDYIAPSAGSHTFTLTVTDPGGLTSTATQTVTVVN